ncbi:proto-oncogene serine/threonine-protein kinase mos isoform X1 [Lasioglossum baleicum]|uniref:proto-oncogene serine/threonine-protein kinase mos isoform X1 n=1 Tax=Lasioglossum baleicum TaxID=434251 RepID=UPI003FCED09E
MASPQRLASKLCIVSPRALKTVEIRQFLSPKTPVKNCPRIVENSNRLSPFNLDTPNRRRILEDGFPRKHATVLGSGAFGTVYKASYKGDQVAAKVMRTGRCTDALNSEKHASFLKHSNIVKILMIEQGASLSLITMELCGTTLQDRLDEDKLNKNERVSILKDVTYALQFCHNAGIVHADVKPKNILMSIDGLPKLTDFGSSVSIRDTNRSLEFHVRLPSSTFIISSLFLVLLETIFPQGTPGYTAPEVLNGYKPTPAADIYSLGIVAWQMLSRKIPFAGLHSHTIIYLSAIGNRPNDTYIDDEFKGVYNSLYIKMWSQRVKDRPTTARVIEEIDAMML